MKTPEGLTHYGGTPEFTAGTVPDKLLAAHALKAGTWGRMRVLSGQVSYYLEGESEPARTVKPGDDHIIPPEERHYIRISPETRFRIEFWK